MDILQIDDERLVTMLRAIAHPARLEIVRTLAHVGDQQCIDLTREVDLAQSTVSEHLRVLKEAGLIEQCAPGPRSAYCMRRDALIWLKQAMVAL